MRWFSRHTTEFQELWGSHVEGGRGIAGKSGQRLLCHDNDSVQRQELMLGAPATEMASDGASLRTVTRSHERGEVPV